MTAAAPMPDHAVTHAHGVPNGTTVFLLHGAFGAKEYWRAQVQALVQAGCRVVAWDAPGYGLSPLPPGFGIDLCARALARLLEKEGGQVVRGVGIFIPYSFIIRLRQIYPKSAEYPNRVSADLTPGYISAMGLDIPFIQRWGPEFYHLIIHKGMTPNQAIAHLRGRK